MKKYETRSDVEEKYKCDLSDYYQTEEDFNKELKEVDEQINKVNKYVGCTKDANKLFAFIEEDIKISVKIENLYIYATLINDLEIGISKNIEKKDKVVAISGKYDSATSFFRPELLKLDKKSYEKLFKDKKELLTYKTYLDNIYRYNVN